MADTVRQGDGTDPRRGLPSVGVLLEDPRLVAAAEEAGHEAVADAVRAVLGDARRRLTAGDANPTAGELADRVLLVLARADADRVRPVINATGVILHTGLGRTVLPERAARALAGMARYCNLQIDLDTGRRGKRNYTTEQLLVRLTGAEAALIVNNNAAATLLMLAALCEGREVIVSRGQLIEIGGSYRLPDCIHRSGAILREVGTTNKTHLRDYDAAIGENTGAILRVNPSNYRVVGFSADVPVGALVDLGQRRGVPVFDDLGCGALVDLRRFGLPHEPTVPESIAAGADLVCFSGDKLIGGPQAGIIAGRREFVERIRKHPLTRMLRVGKLTDLALEQTLRLFLHPEDLPETHPTVRMLTASPEALRRRARGLRDRIRKAAPGVSADVIPGVAAVGGGSLPGVELPTSTVAVALPGFSAERLAGALRGGEPPIIPVIRDDRVVLDVRTLLDGDAAVIAASLARLAAAPAPERWSQTES